MEGSVDWKKSVKTKNGRNAFIYDPIEKERNGPRVLGFKSVKAGIKKKTLKKWEETIREESKIKWTKQKKQQKAMAIKGFEGKM